MKSLGKPGIFSINDFSVQGPITNAKNIQRKSINFVLELENFIKVMLAHGNFIGLEGYASQYLGEEIIKISSTNAIATTITLTLNDISVE
jgi:hypothetical protein